jgi:hypothetical protein
MSGISMIWRFSIARAEGARSGSNAIGYIAFAPSGSKPGNREAIAFQCSLPSFRVVIVAEHGSNSFAALFTMASNTGCTSDGELAITFRMSAVAVCLSSVSFVSLNSRAFSIAITAWSANALTSAIWFSAKPPASPR